MASETTVGNIVGFLRLDITDWNRRVAEARAAAEGLGVVNPDLHIDSNAGEVATELAAVEAEADAAGDSGERMGRSFDHAGQQGSGGIAGLLKAIAPVLPATVPLAAAAAGAGLAFGALGGTALLAFEGIKQAISEGTTQGLVFKGELDSMRSALSTLERVAAAGVLSGFTAAVGDVNGALPGVIGEVRHLSTALGGILSSSVHGAISLMLQLQPVFDVVAAGLQHVATGFDSWANSPAASHLISYMLQNLPELGSLLAALGTDAAHLVEAFAPLGGAGLHAITAISQLLTHIPVGVLTTVAGGALAAYTAFRLLGGLSSMLQRFGGAVGNLSARLTGVGVGSIGLGQRLASLRGPISAAIGVVGLAVAAWGYFKQKQEQAAQQQRELTAAIQQDNGVLGTHAAKVIQSSDAYKNLVPIAQSLGIGTKALTGYFEGNGHAVDFVNKQLDRQLTASGKALGGMTAYGTGATQAHTKVVAFAGAIRKQAQGYQSTLKNARQAAAENKRYAASLGSSTSALGTQELARMSDKNATQQQTTALQKLNAALDQEISKNLQLAGGVTGMDAARLSLIKTLKKDTSTTNGNTSAGVRNRQAIENAVGSLQQYRQTQIKNHVTTKQATETYAKNGAELLRQIAKVDGANSATYRYTKRLLNIPKDVKTKVGMPGYETARAHAIDVRKRILAIPGAKDVHITASTGQAVAGIEFVQSRIASLHGRSIPIRVHYETIGGMPVAHGGANGGVIGRAYANGGFAEMHEAQIAMHGPRLWAEPETGGEAYIPLATSKRPRATRVLQEVAQRFGMSTVPVTVGTNIAPAVPGPAVAVPVNVTFTDDQMRALGAVLGANVYHGAAQHDREVAVALQVASRGSGRSGLVGA